MKDPHRRVVYLLWTVITVLIVGGTIIGFLLVRKADELMSENANLSNENDSLHRQVLKYQEDAAQPSPSPSPSISAPPSASPSPTGSPSASPKP